MENILASLSNISFSWDIFLVLFVFVSSLFYGMLLGKNRIMLIMLSTYISFAIVSVFSLSFWKESLGEANLFLAKFALFIFFIIFSFVLLNRSFFGHLFKVSKALSNTSFLKIFLLSFAQVGLFVSIFFSFILTENGINDFSEITQILFTSNLAKLIWFVLPIVFLGIFKNKKSQGE